MNIALLRELREALHRRLRVVGDRAFYERDPAAHLEELKAASAAVDRITAELGDTTDPRLRHFLERQSYLKAIEWLDAQPV